jgi:hypothetical protein
MPPLLIGAVPYEEIRGGAVCLLASMVHRILRPDEKCSFLKMLGELRKRWNRGPRDNCLKCCGKVWSWREESNLQPAVYKTAALPIELRQRRPLIIYLADPDDKFFLQRREFVGE